ncbi:MAG: amidohydrolase family protein [Pseudomonadota bacterium]
MRLTRLQCAALLPIFVHLAWSAPAQAGTVVDNANGYTLNARNEVVQFTAMAIDDAGRISAIGSAAEVAAKAPGARHVDLKGKTVLPGLIDAHGHVFELGAILGQLDLEGTATLADALKATSAYARANPGQPWLRGRGWNQEIWKLGRFPTAFELDAVVADRPAWLDRIDGHAGWANSRALQLAGIGRDTPDPAGGKIMHDAQGKATGVLVDAAMELVYKVMPKASELESRAMLDGALARMAGVGLTGVHDAGIDASQDAIYRDYATHGKLSTRVYAMIAGAQGDFDKLSKGGPVDGIGNDTYALRAVKLFGDGALGSRGAALIEPYSDEGASRGLLFHSNAEMLALMDKAMRAGYQVNVHAIGDATNRQLLDAYEALAKRYGGHDMRHRIEHAQVVAPQDIARFKVIGVVPSMQPTHATSDMNMAEKRIGAARMQGAYAWRSFLQQGSRIACGSDFPIESPNPFFGIHAAVTRQDASGQPIAGWYPEQAMSLKEALRCFTLDAAWAAHQEGSVGSLEVGKWADFVVIDQDLFKVSPYAIANTQVLQTWLAGRPVFTRQ